MTDTSRRGFLRTASIIASAAAAGSAVACDTISRGNVDNAGTAGTAGAEGGMARATGFDRPRLEALAAAVLPAALGVDKRRAAVDAFIAWSDGYDPVAEEMHGYGYADVRYLPPDPVPAWRAQLDGLDLLARRSRHKAFINLDVSAQREILAVALRRERGGDRLPAPLGASHIAVALLSHWASSPGAWDLALGVQVGTGTCRTLDGAARKPLPVVGADTGASVTSRSRA